MDRLEEGRLMRPQFIAPADPGKHNADMEASIARIRDSAAWRRLDTIMLIPSAETVAVKVVMSWLNLYMAPNNQLYRMATVNTEVGAAYSLAIETILAHEQLSKFKYILTMETDNIPPPDGLIKLLGHMENHPEYDCIGGLYWTKFEGGVPQIWGDPRDTVNNFRPQIPRPGELQECCGTGQGFNLFRLDMFKDPDLRRPWFQTQTEGGVATQDLFFWGDARRHGYRCAIANDVLVGHYDLASDTTW
jgi:hypothetical protein